VWIDLRANLREARDSKEGRMREETVNGGTTTTWVVRPDRDLEDLIPDFMQNRKNELQDIQLAISKNDYEYIRRLAHTLKGICRPYGFEHLETLSKELEVAGQAEDMPKIQQIADKIAEYLKNVRIVYDS
jgi:HPt (histidine-containing phosphotransfer) domain-containing protein